MTRRLVVLVLVLAAAAAVGFVSVRRAGEQLAVIEACDAAARGDWDTALARSEGRTGPDETGRAAAECRCAAQAARGDMEACTDLLDELLSHAEADGWTPSPPLAAALVRARGRAGRALEAAELATRAGRAHPEDPDLFALELSARSLVDDPASLAEELGARVPTRGPAAARMRAVLGSWHVRRGDPAAALAALGEDPPPGSGAAAGRWWETRGLAIAQSGDLPGLERHYERWHEAGGDPDELTARFARTYSVAGLSSPQLPTAALLRRALEVAPDDAELRESLTIRLVLTLVQDGRLEDALEVYDRGRERFPLAGLSREEIERSAEHRELADLPPEQRRGALEFEVDGAAAGLTLRLAPEPAEPVDSAYRELPLPGDGRLRVERSADVAPLRWIVSDPGGAVVASGTVRVRPGRTTPVVIAPGSPAPPASAHPTRLPADGRRRVALLLLDCADWRIVQYLRTRGELPVLDSLIRSGWSGVLASDPPLTGAALESLVHPGIEPNPSVLGWVHRFGVELAGLASVGENPLAGLAWLLPEREDLFAALGSGELSAANLLFAHGDMRAGRHSEVTGPRGRRERVSIGVALRPLDADERADFPALGGLEQRDARLVQTIAAELDAAERIVREKRVDLLALRVEALDILTHAHFAGSVVDAQDDGRGVLFSVYRYLDRRIGEVHDRLDADDVLVVMSDHGIRTAMEHSRFALFSVTGAGIPRGRMAGTPELRGVSRALADWLGVATAWPDTGVAPWAAALAHGEAADHPAPTAR